MITKVFEYNQHFVAMMNIINKARLNPPKEGHKHHIIPRCWFKMNNLPVDNSAYNLVLLTYEDHVKVHKLAYLCAMTSQFKGKMAYAYHRLTKGEVVANGAFTGEQNPRFGKHHSEETIKYLSELQKGRKMSKESSRKKSLATKGVPKSEFGDKFKEHYGLAQSDNMTLYKMEYMWYTRHNHKCRWEL